MGTHPIFESDFDCLTDRKMSSVTSLAPITFHEDGIDKRGELDLTESSLVFKSGFQDRLNLAYSNIREYRQSEAQKLKCQLEIITKTFRKLTVNFGPGQVTTVVNRINREKTAPTVRDLPCFKRGVASSETEWAAFNLKEEYAKMGVPNQEWKLTDLNANFGLCDTYDTVLAVPAAAPNSVITGSAQFRSRKRLPVLTYLHSNAAAIVRCAQPMAGANNRSDDDEMYFNYLVETSRSKSNGLIVDTRPMLNAMANRAQGKGYENIEHYTKCQFQFLGIENIHVMRKSLEKLESEGWLKADWLNHVYAVLDVSNKVKLAIQEGRTVIVHCSDGWDRTSQVCSGAALMLNPRYRTFEGFLSLIQKDWLSMGHKCADRLNLSLANDPKESSPIFLQFLDFTFQLIQQFPTSFEFNSAFLVEIYERIQACEFGDFCGNSPRERLLNCVKEKTRCLLSFLYDRRDNWRNHLYKENSAILDPCVKMCFIPFWSEMYHAARSNKINMAIDNLVKENGTLEQTVQMLEEALSQ